MQLNSDVHAKITSGKNNDVHAKIIFHGGKTLVSRFNRNI